MLKEIGENIRESRKDINLSIVQVSELSGISRQTLSGIEKGIRSGKLMIQYLCFLKEKGVDLNDLFSFSTLNETVEK